MTEERKGIVGELLVDAGARILLTLTIETQVLPPDLDFRVLSSNVARVGLCAQP
jgi:hypothetical protein